jgi:hypothetical protein
VQTAKVGVTKKRPREGFGQGIFFFLQFCDIENLVKIPPKIAKLVKFTLEKQKKIPKLSQISCQKKATKFARKKPLPLGRPRVFLRNFFLFLSQSGDHP